MILNLLWKLSESLYFWFSRIFSSLSVYFRLEGRYLEIPPFPLAPLHILTKMNNEFLRSGWYDGFTLLVSFLSQSFAIICSLTFKHSISTHIRSHKHTHTHKRIHTQYISLTFDHKHNLSLTLTFARTHTYFSIQTLSYTQIHSFSYT